MAIYHLTVKVISRGKGQSAVASAAYRAAQKLFDERLAKQHDYRNKPNVVFSEIAIPKNAPIRLQTREILWNEIEKLEIREDAQLAREIEFALPIEFTQEQAISLARKFIEEQFVANEMIADWNVHWEENNPHVHVMLSLREITENGFGKKVREWNQKELLQTWREQWAVYANAYLQKYQHDIRIDHRSYEEQGIDLIPTVHLGKNVIEMSQRNIETNIFKTALFIRRKNLKRINKKPSRLIKATASNKGAFTLKSLSRVMARYALRNIDSSIIEKITNALEQHDAVFGQRHLEKELVVYAHDEIFFKNLLQKLKVSLVYLGKNANGEEQYTSKKIISMERNILKTSSELWRAKHVYISKSMRKRLLSRYEKQHRKTLTLEQRIALMHITNNKSISCLVGKAGTGKSFLFGAAKQIWEAKKLNVRGIAVLGIAAERLQQDTGIPTRTLASFRMAIEKGHLRLTSNDVLVMDEAGITDSVSMQFVLNEIKKANAKLVLIGDPQQLQPIGLGVIFRMLLDRIDFATLEKVYRQKQTWQQIATQQLSNGEIKSALKAYEKRNLIHFSEGENAVNKLISDWQKLRRANMEQTLILTHRNKDVAILNATIRNSLIESKELEQGISVVTPKGEINISEKDRILFLKNDKNVNVKNGCFGTIVSIEKNERNEVLKITVKLDENRGEVTFSPKDYAHFTHGYAATVHKTQGLTIDNTLVYIVGKHWNKFLMYVAMSRHKEKCILHVDKSSFLNINALEQQIKKSKPKENALDFLHKFAKQRGIKNENNSILRELSKLENDIKIAEKQPFAYLKNAAKESLEKYVLKVLKDKKILHEIKQKDPNIAKKAVKILEETQRSL